MSEMKSINLNELAGTYTRVDEGDYVVRLANLVPKMSKADKPMLEATYEIVKGPKTGATVRQWYSLSGKKNDSGKYSYAGVRAMFDIFSSVGVPESAYAKNFPLDKVLAGRVFQQQLQGKKLEAYVTEEPRTDDPSKMSTKITILGLYGTLPADYSMPSEGEDEEIETEE